MTTYGDMQARIADEMLDAPVSTAQIQNAIQDAVKRYQEERFYFNQLRSAATPILDSAGGNVTDFSGGALYDSAGLMTSPGVEFYPSSVWALDASISHIDTVTVLAYNSRFTLQPETPGWFEDNSVGVTWRSLPLRWTYESEQLRLYPIPDQAYPIIITATQVFATLVDSTDTNPWMVDGEELVRCAATAMLYGRISRDAQQEQRWTADEQRALATLRRKTAQRGGPGRVRVKSWF